MNESKTFDDKLKVLTSLRDAAWQSWDHRRSYEWKINLAIWTAESVFIALILRGELHLPKPAPVFIVIGTLVLCASVVAVHGALMYSVFVSNKKDQLKQYEAEDALRVIAGLRPTSELLKDSKSDLGRAIKVARDCLGGLGSRAWPICQVLITFLLLILAVLAICLKATASSIK
jgi:hypothetical protein